MPPRKEASVLVHNTNRLQRSGVSELAQDDRGFPLNTPTVVTECLNQRKGRSLITYISQCACCEYPNSIVIFVT